MIARQRVRVMRPTDQRWPGRSWYEDEAGAEDSDAGLLVGQVSAQVAIIGGGLAGVATAVSLVERGVERVVLLESDRIGAGASGRNGGFVFAGYSLGNDALIAQVGRERARCLHGWTREAVQLTRERINRYRLDCQVNDAGVVLADWFDQPEAFRGFAERMNRELGFRLDWMDRRTRARCVRSPRYGSALHEPGSFHFHPLRHIRGLASWLVEQGVSLHAATPVRAIDRSNGRWRLRLDQGQLAADEVVLATGGYDRSLRPPLQRALQPIATYIAVTEALGDRLDDCLPQPVAVYDNRFAFDYYRPLPDRRLLWGGRISIAARSPSAIRRLMRRDLARVFPELSDVRLEQAWGGWMSYARHEMPLLGRSPDGLWHALAFGGHGMATTVLAGEILAEALLGQADRLQTFQPWPAVWAGGSVGRVAVQGRYWWLQWRDWLRERG